MFEKNNPQRAFYIFNNIIWFNFDIILYTG